MRTFWILGLIGVLMLLVTRFHDWVWQRGFDEGKKAGYREGVDEGFHSGRMRESAWWTESEEAVEQEREKIRRRAI